MLGVLLNEKLYKNTYSTLKYFSFFLSTKWIGFLFCIFLKWRKKTCQFPFSQNSFTKTPNLIEETPHWRAWGCASALPEFISGPWTDLTHLRSQQCARVSSPPLSYFESCRCSLKGQVPPGCGGCTRPGHAAMPGQSRSCCLRCPCSWQGWRGAEPPSPHRCRKQSLLSKHRSCFLFPRWWEETKDPNCHSQARSLLCAWTRTYL